MKVHESGPPDAPLVVLVHGAPDRCAGFRRVSTLLDDLHVLIYDRRGYGEAVDLEPVTSLREHADDVLDVLGGRQAVLVGHSFGGNVALLAASLRPDLVRAAGSWESSMCWLPGWPPEHFASVRTMAEAEDTEALGERMGRALLGSERWERLSEDDRRARRAEGRAFAADMGFLLTEPFDLTALPVPYLHGLGGDTTGIHLDAAPLISRVSGVEPMVIEGTSHLVHTQAPEKWASFVRAVVALADEPRRAAPDARSGGGS